MAARAAKIFGNVRKNSARRAIAAFAVASACASAASSARAENEAIEAAATKALDAARKDFASKDFGAALEKLNKALAACGASNCTPRTKTAVMRDIGTMQYRKGDAAEAERSFVEALKLEPELELDPRYDAADVHGAWEDAAVLAAEPPPAGDFTFEPAPEQTVNTPYPVYVEYGGNASLSKVVVEYLNSSGVKWTSVELTKMGEGWGGLVPCDDVLRGRMRLVILGFAGGAKPVAHSGARGKPFVVAIRAGIKSAAPHLPGKRPPHACNEAVLDCPPDFPGCGGAKEHEENGEERSDDAPDPPPTPAGARYARWWIGLAGAFDVGSLPAGDNVCLLTSAGVPANSAYYCTNPDGSDFPTRQSPAENGNLAKGQAGHVDGGMNISSVRAMLSVDYALSRHLLAGARLGYVIGSYDGSAASTDGKAFGAPVHLELRGTWLFGEAPLVRAGFAPMVFAGGGASAFDAHKSTTVKLTTVPGARPEDAWVTGGPAFVMLGGGIRYAFSARAALTAAARLNAAFGGSGGTVTRFGPEIGVQYGF